MKFYFIFLFLLLFIGLRCIFFFQNQQAYVDGEEITFSARLLKEPEQKGRSQKFALQPEGYEPIYLTTPLFPEYYYADILEVSGKVSLSDGEKKVFASMSYPKIKRIENDSLLYGLIGFLREKVTTLYNETLPPTAASLLMGIVFGIKTGMPQEFKEALQQTGVFHVVAASGMNVTMVAGALLGIFGFIVRRQFALILSIVGIFFYAFLSGLEPSILRASLMGSIVFLAGITGRQNVGLWTLAVTGYLMLLLDPMLIFDVGFQLSFLATLGILVVKPALQFAQKRRQGGDDNLVSEDFKTTLAAQLGTLPILLSAFGAVSFLSIFVNMLVLWTIPPLMVIGSTSALVGFVFEPLGKLIAFLALPLLMYFEWVVMWLSKFDMSLRVESLAWYWVVGYYVVLFGVIWVKNRGIREVREIGGIKSEKRLSV